MAKKGKALGKDPLFWVRDTRQEGPETSEQPPSEDTPTAHVEPPPPLEPSDPVAPPAEAADLVAAVAAPEAPAPAQAPALPAGPTPLGLFPRQEIREPRGAFLVLVLLNMLLLLGLGLIGFLYLGSRIDSLERRVDTVAPPAAGQPPK